MDNDNFSQIEQPCTNLTSGISPADGQPTDPTARIDDQPGQSVAEKPAEPSIESCTDQAEQAATVEAILFSSDSPLPASKIAQVALLASQRTVHQAIATLNARYESQGSAFRIENIAGGYQMLTLNRYRDVLDRLNQSRSDSKLSQAAMETLAIIAYRQPILRADIEAIRGVACGEVIRGLMEKQLVKIVGRADVIGRPMLYGTTRRFLEVFGLARIEDLPRIQELRSGAADGSNASRQTNNQPGESKPADTTDQNTSTDQSLSTDPWQS